MLISYHLISLEVYLLVRYVVVLLQKSNSYPKKKLFTKKTRKNFGPKNKKKRTKTTRHTIYSAMSSIPSGGPPGETHTQELWYSLRGIDAELQSVLSADKCPCDACCALVSTPIFVGFLLVFCPTKFF